MAYQPDSVQHTDGAHGGQTPYAVSSAGVRYGHGAELNVPTPCNHSWQLNHVNAARACKGGGRRYES